MIQKLKTTYQAISNSLCNPFGFFFLILPLLLILTTTPANATDGGKDRFRTCDPIEQLDYSAINGGKDFVFDTDNFYCWSVVAPLYVTLKTTIPIMNAACGSGSAVPRPAPSPLRDSFDITRAGIRCTTIRNPSCCALYGTAGAQLATFIGAMAAKYRIADEAQKGSSLCGGGLDDEWTSWNDSEMIRNIPNKKKRVEDEVKSWISECKKDPQSSDCDRLRNGFREKTYREWFYGGVEREDNGDNSCPDVTKRFIDGVGENRSSLLPSYPAQKYYMRGTEAGNYACERFNYRLQPNDPIPNEEGINVAFSADRIEDYKKAHSCCIKKSKTTACIDRKYHRLENDKKTQITEHLFCKVGTECKIGTRLNQVVYSPNYKEQNRMICVNTVDLCPYDFNLGLGTTKCQPFRDGAGDPLTVISLEDITAQTCEGKSEVRDANCSFNKKAGKCKNYCQHLNHCVIVGGNDYVYESDLSSPYFSSACVNFIGDSKNKQGYGEGNFVVGGVQKHFTAPVAQCVRETLENVFYNRAGHTKCGNINEYPDQDGLCSSDFYVFQKDHPVEDQSFFFYIQDHLKSGIKLVLTISIMMQGFRMLLTGTPLKHSELIMYVVKIGLVLFFATGNAWQGFFFDGIYNASATFSTVVMNVKTSSIEAQRDGCQFGKVSIEDGSSTIVSEYPKGKQYLAVFDTFDCKIARYLGFGPSASIANIAKIIIPALFSPASGTIGVYFAVLTLSFGFFMIVAGFRALHIFLTSAFAIILLVYVSPITITAILFSKTKPIFDRWLNNIIGYSLQPIILFAYMGFFITIFETLVTGSATFSGRAPTKELVCDKICVDRNGSLKVLEKDDGLGGVINGFNQNVTNPIIDGFINPITGFVGAGSVNKIGSTVKNEICNLSAGDKILDPMSDSVACMMNLNNDKFGSIPVLEPFGVAIPILIDFFSESGRQKILAMMKAVLIIYILASFMDAIPEIASSIMGGNTMPGSSTPNPMAMGTKVFGLIGGIQKRGAGLTKKVGGGIMASRAKIRADSLAGKGKDGK